MATQTAGEIAIWAPEILKLPLHDPIIITKQVDLYNFDIDVADPKPEHKKFLTEKILPILRPHSRISGVPSRKCQQERRE